VLLNLAGGSSVEDLAILEGDSALGEMIRQAEVYGMTHKERRQFARRFRKGRKRSIPSVSVMRRYLADCDDPTQTKARDEALKAGVKSFIPEANAHLRGLMELNASVVAGINS